MQGCSFSSCAISGSGSGACHREKVRRHLGFTLIELLVVISIISLLIAILLPALQAARASARSILCATNVRSIAQASFMYTHDYDGYMPSSQTQPPYAPAWTAYYDFIREYVGGEPFDPAHPSVGRQAATDTGHVFYCPDHEPEEALQRATSYAANWRAGWRDVWVKHGYILDTSPRVAVPLSVPTSKVAWYTDTRASTWFYDVDAVTSISWRHNDTANVGFMDAHVERVSNPDFASDASQIDEPEWQAFFGVP